MIYELRSYDIHPDNWDGYVEWAEDIMMPLLFDKFDFPLVGFFEAVSAENTEHDSFNRTVGVHWILAWSSIEERHQRWTEFRADDEYKVAVQAARDENGQPLYQMKEQVTLLKAWPVSPMQ
jgi:hypothetical protein